MRKGIVFILIATLSFAIMNALAKELSSLHPMQVVFFRALGTFVCILPYMLITKISLYGSNKPLLITRAVVGMLSLSLFFIAIQRVPLGSAISIRYIGPIFGSLLAMIWLKEKVNVYQWLSFGLAFGGVLLLKGFDIRIDTVSLLMLLGSALLVGGVFVILRYLGSREHHLTIILYFMVVSILASLLFVSSWRMPLGAEWYSVVGIGLFGLVGQVFMTRAFQTEETSVLAPFKFMELVFGMMIGFVLFSETYELVPLLGIVLIVVGMLTSVKAKELV